MMKNINYEDKIETIFKELHIKYKILNIPDDDDINYIVNINAFGKLKSLDSIRGIIYFSIDNFTMNLIIPKVYRCGINEGLDSLDVFEIINDINSSLLYGNFLIEDEEVYFRSSFNCGENFSILKRDLLENQIDNFFKGLAMLFVLIKRRKNQNEE